MNNVIRLHSTDLLEKKDINNKYLVLYNKYAKEQSENKEEQVLTTRIYRLIQPEPKKVRDLTHVYISTKQKYRLMLKGRKIANVSTDIFGRYTNLNNILIAEKHILNKYPILTINNINAIYTDPFNIIDEILLLEQREDDDLTLVERTLMLYDPDITYNGITFMQMIENMNTKLINQEINPLMYIGLYLKFNEKFIERLVSKDLFDARAVYGIYKVLAYYGRISMKQIYFMFMQLKHRSTDKYVFKLFRYMLDLELIRFNINPKMVLIGINVKFPYTLFKNKQEQKDIKENSDGTDYQSILQLNDKIREHVEKNVKYTNLYKSSKQLAYKYSKNIVTYREKLYESININNEEDTAKYITYIEKTTEQYKIYRKHKKQAYISLVNEEELIKDYTDKLNRIEYKYVVCNMLGLFVYVNDYNSVNVLNNIGISINSPYIETNYKYKYPLLTVNSFAGLKYLYNKGSSLQLTYNNEIYIIDLFDIILDFDDNEIMQALHWAFNKGYLTSTKNIQFNYLINKRIFLEIMYSAQLNKMLDTITGFPKELTNIVREYM